MCDFDRDFINIQFDKKLQGVSDECFLDYTEYKLRYTLDTYKNREAYMKIQAKLDTPTDSEKDITFRYINNAPLIRQRKTIILRQRTLLENFLDYISKIEAIDIKYKEKRIFKRHST